MSSGPSFLGDLGGFDLASLLQQLRQAPQGVDPQAAAPPPLAMNEGQTQALERAQAGPQDLAALGGSPVDRLLFDPSRSGGAPGGFTGTSGATMPDAYSSRPTPLPPARPSDADLTISPETTGGVQPSARSNATPAPPVSAASTGNPDASNLQPVNAFDPLTGQPVSGSPKLMQAPGTGGPTDGAGRVAAQGSPGGAPDTAGQPSALMQKFAQGLNNPDFSNLMLNIGIGLLTNRGIGAGIGAGLQGYQQSRMGDVKQQLELLKVQQQLQGQQAIRGALAGKGLSQPMIEAAALNPTVLSSVLAQQNKDPQTFNVGGHTYLGRPDQPTNTWQDLGTTAGPPSGFQPTPQGGLAPTPGGPESLEYKKAAAEAVAPDKTVRPLSDPAERARYGIAPGDVTPYQVNADGRVEAVPGSAGGNRAREDVTKGINEDIRGSYQKAQGAVGTLAAISRQKEALDKGIISGSGADWRTQAQAIGSQLLGIDPKSLNESYNFDAASTQKQAELAKAVSQAGHTTNMDLQLGKTIAGGDRSKTEQALRQIVDAQETLARHAITSHNDLIGRAQKISPDAASQYGFYGVEMPDVYRYGQGTPNPLADPGARLPAPGDALGMARAAIARGAPRDAVIGRLRQNNIDPGNL